MAGQAPQRNPRTETGGRATMPSDPLSAPLGDRQGIARPDLGAFALALNVNDIDAAVEFYSTLFDTAPAKHRPGYANFVIDSPALKLVLLENPEAIGTPNHLGVECDSMGEVEAEADRLEAAGLQLDVEGDVVCCYARQDKHWVTGPDGQRWQNYVVLADAQPELEGNTRVDLPPAETNTGCCGSALAAGNSENESSLSACCA
jgi:catechol 2,3-dioxygenase-like lactoylglutathione lyase family enzyme